MLAADLASGFSHCFSITLRHEINYSLKRKKKENIRLGCLEFNMWTVHMLRKPLTVRPSRIQATEQPLPPPPVPSLDSACGHVIPCCCCWWIQKKSSVWLLSAQKPEKLLTPRLGGTKSAVEANTQTHTDEAWLPSLPSPSSFSLLFRSEFCSPKSS